MGFRDLADGMARMFDAARETERACLSAAEAMQAAVQRRLDDARVAHDFWVLVGPERRRDPLAGNEFAWLLRASRRGEENDGLRDAYAAWRRRGGW